MITRLKRNLRSMCAIGCMTVVSLPNAVSAAPILDPLKDYKDRTDQNVTMDLNSDGKPDYVLLIKKPPVEGHTHYDLMVFMSGAEGYVEALAIPSFWDSWGESDDNRLKPTLELSTMPAPKGSTLVIKVTDHSDDGANQQLKFRWENNDFRLIGETKSASPRGSVISDTGEELPGRWSRSKDINWLTGKMLVHCDLKAKKKSGFVKPNYISIKKYDLSADYLDDVCK